MIKKYNIKITVTNPIDNFIVYEVIIVDNAPTGDCFEYAGRFVRNRHAFKVWTQGEIRRAKIASLLKTLISKLNHKEI